MKALIVLEDGSVLHGKGFGAADKSAFGEFVFNTGMTGYQEALTDPSYNGQILMMTYPLIGNYGCTMPENGHLPLEWQSNKIQAEGFVVREYCPLPAHRLATKTIDGFLKEQDIPGISEIDTRALTIKTRQYGTLKSIIATYTGSAPDTKKLLETVRQTPSPDTTNLVGEVSTPALVNEKTEERKNGKTAVSPALMREKIMVVIDCGVKNNIIRELVTRGCSVVRAPYNISAAEIDKIKPDGILVSNGPGDPAHPEIIATTVKTIKALAGKYPMFGICLGQQILVLAFGGKTYKLKFGHRGANQPVKNLQDGKVYITSQNHGFAVDPKSCPKELEITGINVNDGTVEAMRHKDLPIFSVQYHPEASPGPWDSKYLFDNFIELCLNEPTSKR
ncbi:MAG: glutamine-hydrolyzing carbamoyl-phosphate synthase small subunit [Planctomycetes bacterium]|nr:glutamine-hydrolyzing carbamoyl-phosphate synthase small subunit [Planctomycetota bacterium]